VTELPSAPPPQKPRLDGGLLARFAAIVGARNAMTEPAEIAPYLSEERGLYHGSSPLVLRPGSPDEVAAILRLANETRTPIVPQGGNTGLVGGQTPLNGEIVLSLKRLDRIREVDPTSNTMTCEAGVVLARAQEAAAAAGRLFPLSLGAEGSCTIGGNLSTNAGGTGALAYGVARELVLGLEVVLADGRVMRNLRKLKKDNTGYDLRHLFIGAEGTLGIITAAVLKLFPRPRSVETAFIGMASPHAALGFVQPRQRAGGRLGHRLRAHPAHRARIRGAPCTRLPRPADRFASLVCAARALIAGARGPARRDRGNPQRRRRAGSGRRRHHRGEPRAGQGVLALAPPYRGYPEV
jgi:D-lactate dehydrogenase (cytochrome)